MSATACIYYIVLHDQFIALQHILQTSVYALLLETLKVANKHDVKELLLLLCRLIY